MASNRPRKFESIPSQSLMYDTMIPAPRIQPGTAVEQMYSTTTATYFNPLNGLQAQMGQAALGSGSAMTTWVSDSSIWSQLSGTYSQVGEVKKKVFPSHPKMEGKARPYAEELKPHWERARKLGLTSQANAIEKMALKKDIEELTKGAGYPEVTDKDLEAMFDFPRLQKNVNKHNWKATWHNFWAVVGMGNRTLKEKIILRLKKDAVEDSGVAIPFGAQIRLEEAKEKAIFTSFKVVYPNVVTESALALERARERDPALVGESEGCMFLICSWDLPQDIEKAEADIEALKALKIEG